MNFERTPEFEKDLKAFTKKWPSLSNDIAAVESFIETLYVDQEGVDRAAHRKNFFNGKRATILSQTEFYEVVKMRVDCASLGSKDCLWLVFIYLFDGESIKMIELYSKTNKAREDTARIKEYLPKPSAPLS